MTADDAQRGVLVLGRSQLILDRTVAALADDGYAAQGSNDFLTDITRQFDVTKIDLVVFGRQVPPDRQAAIEAGISAVNPRVIFLEGVPGIPDLVVSQVREAFADVM